MAVDDGNDLAPQARLVIVGWIKDEMILRRFAKVIARQIMLLTVLADIHQTTSFPWGFLFGVILSVRSECGNQGNHRAED